MKKSDKKPNDIIYERLVKLLDTLISEAEKMSVNGTDPADGIPKLGEALYKETAGEGTKPASLGIAVDRSQLFRDNGGENIFCDETLKTAFMLVLSSALPDEKAKNDGLRSEREVTADAVKNVLRDIIPSNELENTDIQALINYDRYDSYAAFISDIQSLKGMAERINIIYNPVYNAEKEKKLTEEEEKRTEQVSASALMINMLYRNTLISDADKKNIRVLVLGSDRYCAEFIDKALMAGQVSGYELSVTSVSDDGRAFMKDYVDARPALPYFVKVSADGKPLKKIRDEYAVLDFAADSGIKSFRRDTGAVSSAVNSFFAKKMTEGRGYTYIFISLGDDILNYCAAAAIHRAVPEITVNYVCKTGFVRASGKGLEPVAVDDVRLKGLGAVDSELNRIAFNVHRVWSRNEDTDAVRKQYEKDEYCRNSAMMFAVSLKYKLAAEGISFDDPDKAAAEFEKLIREDTEKYAGAASSSDVHRECTSKEEARKAIAHAALRADGENRRKRDIHNSPIAAKMAYTEHKRWVMEKVTDGWTTLPEEEFESFLRDKNTEKDTAERRHSCIVRCTSGQPLRQLSPEQWDTVKADLYDGLDRVSLKMHRAAKRAVDKEGITALLRALENIFKSLPEENGQDFTAPRYVFDSFRFAVYQIINGSMKYSYRFESIFDDIKNFKINDTAVSGERMRLVGLIRKKLYPAAFCGRFYDYKDNDILFIDNIPQIISSPDHISLITPFDDGRYTGNVDSVFACAASSLILRPEKITYLYNFDRASDPEKLEQKIGNVSGILRSRNIAAAKAEDGISLVILNSLGVPDDDIIKSIGAAAEGDCFCINAAGVKIKCAVTDSREAFEGIVREYASDSLYDGSTALFASAREQAEFMHNVVMYSCFRYFEYNSVENRFENTIDCAFLDYLRNDIYLKAEDVFAFSDAYLVHYESENNADALLPDCSDSYEFFWNQFVYGRMYKGRLRNNYSNTNAAVWNNTLSNPIIIDPRQPLRAEADLRNVTFSYYDNRLNRKIYETEAAYIFYKKFTEDPEHPERDSAKTSKDKVFIKKLTMNMAEKKVNFEYTDEQAKRALSKGGEVLELKCYYEALKTGYFDDVITGYEFRSRDGKVKNELDLVLTKGARTMIVECKATQKLEQGYYQKLDSIAGHVGINCTRVLVNYAYMDDSPKDYARIQAANNRMQRIRGAGLDIITVSDLDEIEDIGNTLVKIMEGTYHAE